MFSADLDSSTVSPNKYHSTSNSPNSAPPVGCKTVKMSSTATWLLCSPLNFFLKISKFFFCPLKSFPNFQIFPPFHLQKYIPIIFLCLEVIILSLSLLYYPFSLFALLPVVRSEKNPSYSFLASIGTCGSGELNSSL